MTNQTITPEHEELFKKIVELRIENEIFDNHEIYFDFNLDTMKYSLRRLEERKVGKALLSKIK